MTLGILLLIIIIATIFINAIVLLIKRKVNKASVDTDSFYFIVSMMLAGFIFVILFIVALATFGPSIVKILQIKVF